MGENLSSLLNDDVHQLYLQNHKVKQIETLNSYQSSEWLLQRPQALILSLCNLYKIDINTAGPSKLNVLAKIIELIYYCKNCKLVLPNHLIESLLFYYFTNSKSYEIFSNGLCKSVFDNNQKIGKTYLISGTNKVPSSVITSHL